MGCAPEGPGGLRRSGRTHLAGGRAPAVQPDGGGVRLLGAPDRAPWHPRSPRDPAQGISAERPDRDPPRLSAITGPVFGKTSPRHQRDSSSRERANS